MTTEEEKSEAERVKNPLVMLLLGMQKLCRERAGALAKEQSGSEEAARAGSPWPDDIQFIASLVDAATKQYLELSLLSTPTETFGQRRRYYRVQNLNDSDTMPRADDRMEVEKEDANVVGSLCVDGQHRPVIDIDHPCQLVPSSTPGHYHLYIDVPTSWPVYERLLWALADAGVVSVFYARAAAQRRQSFVRVPWVKKETTERKAPGVEPADAWQERELEREARAMIERTKRGVDGAEWDRRRLAVAFRIEGELREDVT